MLHGLRMPQIPSVPAIHSFNKYPSPVLCQAWVSFCCIVSFNSLRALQGCYYNLLCTGDKTDTFREVRNIFKTIELESAGVGIKSQCTVSETARSLRRPCVSADGFKTFYFETMSNSEKALSIKNSRIPVPKLFQL